MKRCPRNAPAQQQQKRTTATSQFEAETSFLGGIFRSASSPSNWFNHAATAAAASQQQRTQQQSRPASKVLPPTQQPPAESQMSEAALRVRQSPALSLFNQLAGLVAQLEQSRDFFLDWPQLVCQRIRRSNQANGGGGADLNSGQHSNATNSGSGECWNGRDFSGYSKALAPFGQPIRSDHPELAVSTTQPISEFILKLVARFKDAQTQLARSARSPITPFDLMALTAKLASGGVKSGHSQQPEAAAQVALDSDGLGGNVDGGPLASSATSDQQQQQQKLLADQLTAMAVNPAAGLNGASDDLSGSSGEQSDESDGGPEEPSEDEDSDGESDESGEDVDENSFDSVPNCPQGDDNCERPLDTPHSTESTENLADFVSGGGGGAGSPTLDFTSPNLAYPRQTSPPSPPSLGGEIFSNFVTVPQQYPPAMQESNPALAYPNSVQQTDSSPPSNQSPMEDFGEYTSAPGSSSACSIVVAGGCGAQWQLGGLKLSWPYAASHLLLLGASFLFSLCFAGQQRQMPAPM